jgi:hypothetical protein
MRFKARARRWPSLLLIVAGLVIGAVTVSSVTASPIGGSVKKAIKKGDKKTLKKALAIGDKRYAGGTLQYVRSDAVTVATGADGSAIAKCPTGTAATGGGGIYPAANSVQILRSNPSNGTEGQAGFTAWEFRIRNGFGFDRAIRAYVICASVANTSGNYTPGAAAQ